MSFVVTKKVIGGRTYTTWTPQPERYWAVGSSPARLAHRIVGQWPGNHAYQTACGNSICLHAEFWSEAWPFPTGGMSFTSVEEIPAKYRLCLKCVAADETVV